MIVEIQAQYRQALSIYADELLEELAKQTSRYNRPKKPQPPIEQIESTLTNKKFVSKILADLSESQQQALLLFRRAPLVYWRWDHAVRILTACAIESPYRTIQELLGAGLLCMRPAREGDLLSRFELADGLPREALPYVGLAAPLADQELDIPEPAGPLAGVEAPATGWREADGWELPIRLAVLWRIATRAPIKRTQQNLLFKRDQERLSSDPLLGAATLDTVAPIESPGVLTYAIALEQGWLSQGDEQSPIASLESVWPKELYDLQLLCARSLMTVEFWNELGKRTPVGNFAQEIASARFLLLLWLARLPEDQATTTEALAEELERVHPPFNAQGELTGPFRQAQNRTKLAKEWTSACVLGPMYQCGLISVRTQGPSEATLIRLSPMGRRFVGSTAELPVRPKFPQTLLAQPNHEIIVYRQGLNVELLCQLVSFAEPKSSGAALAFVINADSIYYGLEAGITGDRIVAILRENGGREPPPGLAQSVETWSQKRDRLSVYNEVSVFEFADEKDLADALARGMEGTRIGERFLLVASDQEKNFKHLKFSASRDYRFPPEQCVESGLDGVTLKVDLEKSDLMLESELRRFTEPMAFKDRNGRQQFRVSTDSLAHAFQQGLRLEHIEEWYQQRTGAPPPPSVQLLFRSAAGFRVEAKPIIMVGVESPLVAEGLLQHPLTADLFGERLGPAFLAVSKENLPPLREALDQLGIELVIADDVDA